MHSGARSADQVSTPTHLRNNMSEVASEGELGSARAAVNNTAVKDTKVVRGYPLVGALIDIFRDGPGFMTRVAREHAGEIVGVRLGPITIYLVTHPDHVQHVVQDWRSFGKGGGMFKATRPFL